MKENKTKEGVNVTESGLQYRVIEEGKGPHPRRNSTVRFKYVIRDIDGNRIGQETDKPISSRLDRVIEGVSESLQLMSPGAKYEICIPWDLAYGEKGTGRIPPFSVLIYDLELLTIEEY